MPNPNPKKGFARSQSGKFVTKSGTRLADIATNVANSLSYWREPQMEEVKHPDIHLFAIMLYLGGMVLYIVYAAINLATYPTPTLYESAESNKFSPVALKFEIDCQDCRVVPGIPGQDTRPGVDPTWNDKSTLWILRWDYTALSNGCAARAVHKFSPELRAFCAEQNGGAAAAPSEPLDKCTIKNTDQALLRRAKSPSARIMAKENVSWRRGWGGNPNYGEGSFYEVLHAVPLCFVENAGVVAGSAGAGGVRGIQLQIVKSWKSLIIQFSDIHDFPPWVNS